MRPSGGGAGEDDEGVRRRRDLRARLVTWALGTVAGAGCAAWVVLTPGCERASVGRCDDEIAILGSVEPRVDGAVVGVPSGQTGQVWRYLRCARRRWCRQSLRLRHCRRAAPVEAMGSLQVTVSRLRRSLGAAGAA